LKGTQKRRTRGQAASGAAAALRPKQTLLDGHLIRSGQAPIAQAQAPLVGRRRGSGPQAATGVGHTAKRGRVASYEDEDEDDDNESWEEHLQRLLRAVPDGAKEFERLRSKVSKAVDRLLQGGLGGRVLEAARKDKEAEVCSRSLMAFNVDRWRGEDEKDVTLEEKITEDIHKMSNYRVTVLEVTAYKPQDGRPMAARITLGSSRQKRTLYRAVADNMKKRTRIGHCVRPVSFRDCFTADKTLEAKKLAAMGLAIKRKGVISAFRVISQGPACIPVLQTRTSKGQWSVYLPQQDEDNRVSGQEDGTGEARTSDETPVEAERVVLAAAREKLEDRDSKAANMVVQAETPVEVEKVVLAAARDKLEDRDSKAANMVVQAVIDNKMEDSAKSVSACLKEFSFKKSE